MIKLDVPLAPWRYCLCLLERLKVYWANPAHHPHNQPKGFLLLIQLSSNHAFYCKLFFFCSMEKSCAKILTPDMLVKLAFFCFKKILSFLAFSDIGRILIFLATFTNSQHVVARCLNYLWSHEILIHSRNSFLHHKVVEPWNPCSHAPSRESQIFMALCWGKVLLIYMVVRGPVGCLHFMATSVLPRC